MDKSEKLTQLLVYSITSQLVYQKKISKQLEESLGVNQRKELESRIKELEEENLQLRNSIDSQNKVALTQTEENKLLRDKKKVNEKKIKELEQEVQELRSEKNLLKSRLENTAE
jgi:chromosome segregation ATPase